MGPRHHPECTTGEPFVMAPLVLSALDGLFSAAARSKDISPSRAPQASEGKIPNTKRNNLLPSESAEIKAPSFVIIYNLWELKAKGPEEAWRQLTTMLASRHHADKLPYRPRPRTDSSGRPLSPLTEDQAAVEEASFLLENLRRQSDIRTPGPHTGVGCVVLAGRKACPPYPSVEERPHFFSYLRLEPSITHEQREERSCYYHKRFKSPAAKAMTDCDTVCADLSENEPHLFVDLTIYQQYWMLNYALALQCCHIGLRRILLAAFYALSHPSSPAKHLLFVCDASMARTFSGLIALPTSTAFVNRTVDKGHQIFRLDHTALQTVLAREPFAMIKIVPAFEYVLAPLQTVSARRPGDRLHKDVLRPVTRRLTRDPVGPVPVRQAGFPLVSCFEFLPAENPILEAAHSNHPGLYDHSPIQVHLLDYGKAQEYLPIYQRHLDLPAKTSAGDAEAASLAYAVIFRRAAWNAQAGSRWGGCCIFYLRRPFFICSINLRGRANPRFKLHAVDGHREADAQADEQFLQNVANSTYTTADLCAIDADAFAHISDLALRQDINHGLIMMGLEVHISQAWHAVKPVHVVRLTRDQLTSACRVTGSRLLVALQDADEGLSADGSSEESYDEEDGEAGL